MFALFFLNLIIFLKIIRLLHYFLIWLPQPYNAVIAYLVCGVFGTLHFLYRNADRAILIYLQARPPITGLLFSFLISLNHYESVLGMICTLLAVVFYGHFH